MLMKYIKAVTTLSFYCRNSLAAFCLFRLLSPSKYGLISALQWNIHYSLVFPHLISCIFTEIWILISVSGIIGFTLKTHSRAYSPEWSCVLWFMRIRNECKETNFQHLELLGVTFHLGLKQTKSTVLFWWWRRGRGRNCRRLTDAFLCQITERSWL